MSRATEVSRSEENENCEQVALGTTSLHDTRTRHAPEQRSCASLFLPRPLL